ncbi:hypothetical protein [Lysinibacter sp. HNR]|uniref:hypothetical protein n=1 Tax=Lysinibacter sp. HNR TaxID=3031408 RepID=UPI002435FE18|nr:hypothetical protein [Lysinibacter sp. HNR]WGD38053.1 hypothetical protein FrondiHNR_03810 [Lysinibacter sp. HNR]
MRDYDSLPDIDAHFVTRNVTDEERAAVIAVLSVLKVQEAQKVHSVISAAREPWKRSQRVPEGIPEHRE